MNSSPADTLKSISEEIKRYSLPYGALGFASNVLTCYTILCLWFGRKPLWPFSKVAYPWLDLALGTMGFLIPTLLSIVAIVRCKDSWELLAIGIWKMTMSLMHGIAAVHVPCMAILEKRKTKQPRNSENRCEGDSGSEEGDEIKEPAEEIPGLGSSIGEEVEAPEELATNPLVWVSWWDILYIPGMCAGLVGLMALVAKDDKKHAGVLKLTAGFYAVAGAAGLVVVAVVLSRLRSAKDRATVQRLIVGGLIWMVGTFNVLRIFYSDWALGMMSDNVAGLPSGDAKAVSWLYLASERLPVFSL